MSAIDRARVLNRQSAAEIANLHTAIATGIGALVAAAGLAAAAFGYSLPMSQDMARYDLVQVSGTESDIVDYDLTSDDCRTALRQFTAAGQIVFCELSR